jgi:methylenetetrahydrofolate dehydrogenase (NADP+)/methenyltetrahydrofolate cyclohydrolase
MILDGKSLANIERERIADEVSGLGFKPGLAVILVGDDPASAIYVRSKERASEKAGFKSSVIRMQDDTSRQELIAQIRKLNGDKSIHGILVQLPLPKHINEEEVINSISPLKDVDCFHPENFGRLFAGNQIVEPCTPKGIMRLLEYYKIEIKGRNALIIGRSNIVGKPIAMLLMQKHATITIAHSRTADIPLLARNSDIIVSAIGKAGFVTGDMVKEGASVIDVGINRIDDPQSEKGYRVVGDVDFDTVSMKAGAITPVPGGVGPMTIAMLLQNTLELAKLQAGV